MEKVKVMIVDDSKVSRAMLKGSLSKTNFEVVAMAKNAAEAVQMYEQFNPAVVTMEDRHDQCDEGCQPCGAGPRCRDQRVLAEAGQHE